jgi:hypothetical protein
MSLSGLPDDVLKIIMQHVPLRDRLTSCCLVNRRLHAAAVAAIDVMMLRGDHTINKAFTWLASYGHHLTKLHLVAFKAPLLQLPCPNLQELNLDHCYVQLGPTADGQRGVLEACTKLTRLELGCDIMDQPLRGSMLSTCLDRLQHLQHLHVLPERNSMPWDHYAIQGLPISTLPRLQHLTYFVFENLTTCCSWVPSPAFRGCRLVLTMQISCLALARCRAWSSPVPLRPLVCRLPQRVGCCPCYQQG